MPIMHDHIPLATIEIWTAILGGITLYLWMVRIRSHIALRVLLILFSSFAVATSFTSFAYTLLLDYCKLSK